MADQNLPLAFEPRREEDPLRAPSAYPQPPPTVFNQQQPMQQSQPYMPNFNSNYGGRKWANRRGRDYHWSEPRAKRVRYNKSNDNSGDNYPYYKKSFVEDPWKELEARLDSAKNTPQSSNPSQQTMQVPQNYPQSTLPVSNPEEILLDL